MDAPLFFFDQEAELVQVRELAGGTVAVFSTRSPTEKGANEDGVALIPCRDGAGVLAVADGLGGLPGGARAARTALETLAAVLAEESGRALREALLHGFEEANQAVVDLGVGSATTLSACEIRLPDVRTYHVGDSPILIVGGKGKLKFETIAHSPVGYAVEAGLLDPEEALHHESRHLVSNILGGNDMRVDMSARRKLSPRDTIVISSDGLVDNLRLREIAERVKHGSPEAAVRDLVDECLRRMRTLHADLPSKPDDLTVAVFRPG